MANVHRFARRQHGVCTGHLWKQDIAGKDQKKAVEERKKSFVYCVLVGVNLTTYQDVNAYVRGDHPVSLVRVVGASAWNHSQSITSDAPKSNTDTSFRMVTSQGTHIYCTAPTVSDCETWLASLHAGLEASFSNAASQSQELPPLVPPSPKIRGSRRPYCRSCGKAAIGELLLQGVPLPQYGGEQRTGVCPLCAVAQGVLLDIQRLSNLYCNQTFEESALETAYNVLYEFFRKEDDPNSTLFELKLVKFIQSPPFGICRRTCPQVEQQCRLLLEGRSPAAFLESIASKSKEDIELGELKKQAFRVAGDMGSAMKLLQDYCFSDKNGTDMLSYVLEFFLDLCEEGELTSVAFFWPQLQCIHLRMLPPENAHELKRVDLFEDFLLTVACKYSIQLALELVWGYSADLEDSLMTPNCSPTCKRRRFSVLRFVCELESLLFDFEHGWGGGSVSLKNMVHPSPHQITLLRLAFLQLQDLRLKKSVSLSRSIRMDKLKYTKFRLPPSQASLEALRVAQNADYFSSHLSFTRRLGDVTEKMRFMEVEERAGALEKELNLLNSSGGMGGDPLNRIHDNLIRVVRVPNKEGHVFRSKERTPVLLLMELLEEGVGDHVVSSNAGSSLTNPDKNLVEELIHKEATSLKEGLSNGNDETEQLKGVGTDNSHPGDDEETDDTVEESMPNESNGDKAEDVADDAKTEINGIEESYHVVNEATPELKKGEGTKNVADEAKSDYDENVEQTQVVAGEAQSEHEGDIKSRRTTEHKDSIYTMPQMSFDEEVGPSFHTPRALGKLKHFDNQRELQIPFAEDKEHVEVMVNTALIDQLDLPSLDHTENPEASEEGNLKDEGLPGKPSPSRQNRSLSAQSSRKMSAFGSDAGDISSSLPNHEIRREVLTHIMSKGMSGSHTIAAGAASAAQKSLQDLDRRRAVDMILHGDELESKKYVPPGTESKVEGAEAARKKLLEIGLDQAAIAETLEEEAAPALPSEEDEAMEALRLLLLQNRVGQGTMSLESAAMAMAQPVASSIRNIGASREAEEKSGKPTHLDKSEMIEIDAGDVDTRLSGCGALPPAVLSALTLWKAEVVSNGELLELVKKDLNYIRHAGLDDEDTDKLIENSQFWGRFAFGERWAEKKARIAASSPHGTESGWDLIGVIIKSNDDLRQEAFVMQLIELCDEAFQLAGLELWLHPYRVLATGRTTGVIEMVKNAMSFDSLKKRPGYGKGGLREHLKRMTEYTADPADSFRCAQRNFVSSLAAYSLLSYFFLFKDRHNGNILLDTAGHVIHIDFGFVFGVAPGGSFSLEMSTPFKLTEEMMQVMGGMESPLFSEFVTLFCCGFLALQAHVDTFATIVEITCRGSSFKCFDGREADEVVSKLRERFASELGKEASVAYALDLIKQATKSYGTKQYDYFQYLSQGIAA